MISPIKQHWLDCSRIKLYSGLALVFFLVIAFGFIRYSNLIDPKGYTIVTDFTVFWDAAQLGLTGRAANAYVVPDLHAALSAIDSGIEGNYGWFYPPMFYLIVLPFGLMPLIPAYIVFMLSTLVGYVLVICRIFWCKETLWCLAGFSGVWLTLRFGQNSFLTASLAGAALLSLEQRPVLAGIFIGLLSIKPHLAVLFPVALIAIGAWRAFITAIVVATAFMAVAIKTFGVIIMSFWIQSMNIARSWTETGSMSWTGMPTVFASLRLLKVPIELAYACHFLVAMGAVVTVWKIWRHCKNWPLRNAALTAATLLISPYLFEYDLVWLALPVTWMIRLGLTHGWIPGDREILAVVWLLPLLTVIVANHTSIQIAPMVILTLLWIIFRRIHVTS